MNEYITDLIQYTIDFESIDDSIHYKCLVAEFRAGLGLAWGHWSWPVVNLVSMVVSQYR